VATEEKVNLREKLALFSDHWRPRQVATLNDYKVLLVKVEGEFVWHSHPETDDFFLVVDGVLEIQLRDRTVTLGPGELFVVPAGVEHCPRARFEAHVLLIEPIGTVNTGDAQAGDLTTEPQPL
jgi:mannose-6-phosphate isomerase-like protein (cupin superfamily)